MFIISIFDFDSLHSFLKILKPDISKNLKFFGFRSRTQPFGAAKDVPLIRFGGEMAASEET